MTGTPSNIPVAFIGAGNRARKYISCLPECAHVRYLVDPEPLRLQIAADICGVPEGNCFSSAAEFYSARRDVAAVIVAAPDRLHVPLAIPAVERGWHVLLEKPVAPCEEDYISLMDAAARTGAHVGVCLEMRFHPFFRRIKQIYDSGVLGRVSEIDHTEHIGPDRMAHTFVRGLWSRTEDSGPIFLSKCSHDADFLLWLTGEDVLTVSSSGRIAKFLPDPTAPAFCIDCNRTDCPYSAVRLYKVRGEWTSGFDVPPGGSLSEVIDAELRGGRYGRCVYHCNNDVYDTQDVDAVLTGGITLHMHLEGTSMMEGRSTVIRGSAGTLESDGSRIRVVNTAGECVLDEDYSALAALPLHAGADQALLEDFFGSVAAGRVPASSLESAFAGHKLCWLAK